MSSARQTVVVQHSMQITRIRLNWLQAAMLLLSAALLGACGDGGGEGNVGGSAAPATGNQSAPADSGTGTAMLSWMPPLENNDGSQLVDLAGYRVLYGRSAGNLSRAVSITNPSVNIYLVEGLGLGTWYFGVVAVNSQGVQSSLSNVASKTIT